MAGAGVGNGQGGQAGQRGGSAGARVAWRSKAGDAAKSVIVVNDDIDVADLRQLVWAIDGRNDRGQRGQIAVEDRLNWPVSPYLNPDFGSYPAGWKATRLVMNCLPPDGIEHPARTGFDINCPRDLKAKILDHWESDGFPRDAHLAAGPKRLDWALASSGLTNGGER